MRAKRKTSVFKPNNVSAGRSEILSDECEFNKGRLVRIGELVYRILGPAKEVSGHYPFSYPAKIVGHYVGDRYIKRS